MKSCAKFAILFAALALSSSCSAQEPPAGSGEATPAATPTTPPTNETTTTPEATTGMEAAPQNATELLPGLTGNITTVELATGENTTIAVEPEQEVRLIIRAGGTGKNIILTTEEAQPGTAPLAGNETEPANVTIVPVRPSARQHGKIGAPGQEKKAGAEALPGAGGIGGRRRRMLFF